MDTFAVAERPGTQELIERLDRPETAELLHRLLDRLDIIVFAADAADGLLRRGDELTNSMAENVAELRQIGIAPDAKKLVEKLPQLTQTGLQAADLASSPAFGRVLSSGLLERLGDPETIASLHGLLDHLDLASFALSSADGFLKRSDGIVESVAESVGDAKKLGAGLDLNHLKELIAALPALIDTAVQVAKSGVLTEVQGLLDTAAELHKAGVLAPESIRTVGDVGAAVTETRKKGEYAAAAPKGIFGLLGALRDPDVRASLGFGIAFARNYGRKLRGDSK